MPTRTTNVPETPYEFLEIYGDSLRNLCQFAPRDVDITGVEDCTGAIQEQVDLAYNNGGGVVLLPAGNLLLKSFIVPKDGVTFKGAGMGITVLLQTNNSNVFARGGSGTSIDADYMAFEDFTVYGTWEANQSQGSLNTHFAINRVRIIRWTRVESLYCRWMCISSGYNDEAIVEGSRFLYSARDAVNLTGSSRCKVINNTFRHGFDDAIAIHQTAANGNPPDESHVIANNIIEDMNGIKGFGIRKATIHHNVIVRPKAYGIMISTGGVEGYSDALAIDISHNVITDPVNTNKFGGASQQHGIYLASRAQSFQNPVVGGASPDYNYPEDFWGLSNSSTAQNVGGSGLQIHSNIIKWTLPHAATYSSWAFDVSAPALGRGFGDTGWQDPAMTSGHERTGTGIVLGGALLDVSIKNNEIYGCSVAIDGSTLTYLGMASVSGNRFARFVNAALLLETGSQMYGLVKFKDNDVDGDPYFESANRSTNGTWNAGASPAWPAALDIVQWSTVDIVGNRFRNLNAVAHFSGAFTGALAANTYCMYPDAAFAIASAGSGGGSAGIRRPYGIDEMNARVVWEVSDPTNSSYGQILYVSPTMVATVLPTTGYFINGQYVKNSSTFTSTQSVTTSVLGTTFSSVFQYQLDGWRRLTTGSTHVLNTDWRENRYPTGN